MQWRALERAGIRLRPIARAACLTLACAWRVDAQGAVVSGRVTDAATNTPIADARVMVASSSVAATTAADGRYTLRGVPVGSVEIRVLRVGYQELKKPIVATADAPVTLDFTMTRAVVQLQEVVTTATGEQRKVELGNALATINASKRVEEGAIANLADLMVAKAPGVIVSPPNMTGAAPVIRVRGANSISLSNDPIFIVDGVRIASSSINAGLGGTNFSYLNTMSPEEIEDIEIVKGPSAATLYGTQAANGVVVITTKKGKAGASRWNWFAEGGSVQDRNTYPATYALWGHAPNASTPIRCQLATMSPTTCIADSLTSINLIQDKSLSPIRDGHNANYGLQVAGGTESVRYFVSGDLFNELGLYHMPEFAQAFLRDTMHTPLRDEWVNPEALQRTNLRANISAAVSPKFDLNINTGFSKSDQRAPNVDDNVTGIGGTVFLTSGTASCNFDYACVGSLGEPLHGYARASPAQIFQQTTTEGIQRLTGSVDAQWRPLTWMQNSATVGVDFAALAYTDLCRFQECSDFSTTRLGFAVDNHAQQRNFTTKLVSNSSWNPRGWLNVKTSLGADYVNTETENTNATGSTLPPGAQTVGAGATRTATDQLPTAVKTLGLYVQEQFGVRDRLFVTGAVRTDQNSAFGTNFQRVFYPKASLSWILSDESFFPQVGWVNQFRLRSAYGQSGVQPGATDALRTFSATTVNLSGAPTTGLIENTLGNPNLKPERSGEIETGFESRLFQNRVNLDVTYYNKKTKDALIALPIAPSAAPSALTVRSNLASVQNTGWETTISTVLVDHRAFGWDMTINGSHNSNKIASLGVDANGQPNKTIGTGSIRDSVGLTFNGLFIRPYTFKDANNDGIIQEAEVTVDTGFVYRGYTSPRDLVSIQNGFDLLQKRLRINVLLDYKGGYNYFNETADFICRSSPKACREDQDKTTPIELQARAVARNSGTILNGTRYTSTSGFWENGQFWRLREVSATLQMPSALAARIRARDANLTLSGRNLHKWTKYTGVDPESNFASGQTGVTDAPRDFITQPPRTYFTARLNLHY
jgi:TonB-linked SusC/RagA family outer membrane protein